MSLSATVQNRLSAIVFAEWEKVLTPPTPNDPVEAGSILITTRDDLVSVPDAQSPHEGAAGCPDALVRWSDAPMVVLDSWDELYPEVDRLMSDPAGLDDMQRRLTDWYERMMSGTVRELEDFLLGSFAREDE